MGALVLDINVEETNYVAPSDWRMLGARGKADHVMALCGRHGIKPKSVLEVGAGDGSILRCLSEGNFCEQLYGLEISQSGVDVIHQQKIPGLVSCRIFDGYRIPFEDGFFDVLVLSHVLEHVEYERALLRELKRVSKYQVIEIPMDCNSLGNEVYHLLGPSYGHINAHTPASLRFLLATEGYKVVDDLLGQYSLELQEYDNFVNNSRERTPKAVEGFRRQYRRAEAEFAALPRSEQQRHASFYTVLTCKEESEERLERALKGMKQCIASGQVQAARLIFDYHIPKPLASRSALEIARDAANTNPQIALEFLDRVFLCDHGNVDALALRNRIERSMANHPMHDDPRPVLSTANPSRWRDGKEYLKARFPRMASTYRKLRRL